MNQLDVNEKKKNIYIYATNLVYIVTKHWLIVLLCLKVEDT